MDSIKLSQATEKLKRRSMLPQSTIHIAKLDGFCPVKQEPINPPSLKSNTSSTSLKRSVSLKPYSGTRDIRHVAENSLIAHSMTESNLRSVQSHILQPSPVTTSIVSGMPIMANRNRMKSIRADPETTVTKIDTGLKSNVQASRLNALPNHQTNNLIHRQTAIGRPAPVRKTQLRVPDCISAGKGPITRTSIQHRPEFSISQQHFTPKMLKSPPRLNGKANFQKLSVYDMSSEFMDLRNQILQLHLIHCDSAKVQARWQRSAEQKYRILYEDVSRVHACVRHQDHRLQKEVNKAALVAWCVGMGTAKASRAIQTLSNIVVEISDLSGVDGRYTRMMEIFDYWYAQACGVLQMREENVTSEAQVVILEGIGDGWKADAVNLRLKATTALDRLRILGIIQERSEDSDLARLARVLTAALENMVQELDTLQAIENQMVLLEQSWINASLYQIATDMSNTLAYRAHKI